MPTLTETYDLSGKVAFVTGAASGLGVEFSLAMAEAGADVVVADIDGVFSCAREALKGMVEQGSGTVVDIASMWGLTGASSVFPIPACNAPKGAVCNLTRELFMTGQMLILDGGCTAK